MTYNHNQRFYLMRKKLTQLILPHKELFHYTQRTAFKKRIVIITFLLLGDKSYLTSETKHF